MERDKTQNQIKMKTVKSMEQLMSHRAERVPSQLNMLSYPPTKEELQEFKDVEAAALPEPYVREASRRVYCNRSLRLDKIEWIGFDMVGLFFLFSSLSFFSFFRKGKNRRRSDDSDSGTS